MQTQSQNRLTVFMLTGENEAELLVEGLRPAVGLHDARQESRTVSAVIARRVMVLVGVSIGSLAGQEPPWAESRLPFNEREDGPALPTRSGDHSPNSLSKIGDAVILRAHAQSSGRRSWTADGRPVPGRQESRSWDMRCDEEVRSAPMKGP